jgi:uncharacterized protein
LRTSAEDLAVVPKLGVKWSPIACGVLDLVDCVEVPGWAIEGLPDSHPVLLHNIDLDFSLARPNAIDDAWIHNARRLIQHTDTPWLSLHLGFSAEEVSFAGHMLPRSTVLDRETCRERFLGALNIVRDGIGVPLLLENLDYCPEGAYEHVCEPDFIAEILNELDCGLLLDLAHARVSADWLGYDIEDYLDALPLERVMQIHLSGPRHVGDHLDDSHYELTSEDYGLTGWLLERCDPEVVLLEYTRDADHLRQQLLELQRITSTTPRG